jgi:hypothetical protein
VVTLSLLLFVVTLMLLNLLLLLQEDHKLWVEDLLNFTRSLQDSSSSSELQGFAGLPTYLLGSSLGGNLAVHAALQAVRVLEA